MQFTAVQLEESQCWIIKLLLCCKSPPSRGGQEKAVSDQLGRRAVLGDCAGGLGESIKGVMGDKMSWAFEQHLRKLGHVDHSSEKSGFGKALVLLNARLLLGQFLREGLLVMGGVCLRIMNYCALPTAVEMLYYKIVVWPL